MKTSPRTDEIMLAKGYVPVRLVSDKTGRHISTLYRAIKGGKLRELEIAGVKYVAINSVIEWLGRPAAEMLGLLPPVPAQA